MDTEVSSLTHDEIALIDEYNHFYDQACYREALGLAATILSRVEASGTPIQEFASRHGQGFLVSGAKS